MERPEIDSWTEKQPFCDIRECCDIQDVKKLEVYTDHLESQLEEFRAENQELLKLIRFAKPIHPEGSEYGINWKLCADQALSKQDGE